MKLNFVEWFEQNLKPKSEFRKKVTLYRVSDGEKREGFEALKQS